MVTNKDLITKCEIASQKYVETLRKKALSEDVKYLAWKEDDHKKQILSIKKSTEQLKVQ